MKKTVKKMDWNQWKEFKKETKNFTDEKKIEAKLPELNGKWRIHLWCQMNCSVKFIKKHFKEIDFDYYFYNNEHITTKIIDAFIDKWTSKHWNYIVRRFIKGNKKAEDIITKYADYLDWFDVCEYVKLSEDFIRMNAEYVNWKAVSRYQHMTEDFIEEFTDKLDWSELSINKKVKSEILRNNKDKTTFHKYYTNKKKVDEDLLNKNANDVNWYQLSNAKRKLSNEFIRAHKDKIKIADYIRNHKVDKDFIEWIVTDASVLAKVLSDYWFSPKHVTVWSGNKSEKLVELDINKNVDHFYKLLAKTNKGAKMLVDAIYDVDHIVIDNKVVKTKSKLLGGKKKNK